VIFSAGIKANSEILSAQGIDVEPNGTIIINDRGETSVKDVYAAGDVSTIQNSQTNLRTYLPMGTHSNKMGRAAGANAVGSSKKHSGGYGTAIIKLFNIDFARTGYHPNILEKENIEYLTTTINAGSTPSYYPDPKNMTLRIYYTPSGDLLGAEAYGGNGVDKRIDILATCILAKMNVRDLGSIDLAYAPPFSSAKDPIAVAGYVAENQLDKKVQVTSQYVGQFENSEDDYQLLDVRSQKEVERQGMINQAINIPLDDLRERLSELDKDRKHLVYCAGGMRAYLACRILVQNEVSDCSNLEGGYTLYQKLN
jgi:rhodanese-related sulfurtransferase